MKTTNEQTVEIVSEVVRLLREAPPNQWLETYNECLRFLLEADMEVGEQIYNQTNQLLNEPELKMADQWAIALFLWALSSHYPKAVVPLVDQLLQKPRSLAEEYIKALSSIADPRVAVTLRSLLRRSQVLDGSARRACIESLIILRDTEAIAEILPCLGDPEETVREAVIRYLSEQGDGGRDALVAQLEREEDADNLTLLLTWVAERRELAAIPALYAILATDWPKEDPEIGKQLNATLSCLETR